MMAQNEQWYTAPKGVQMVRRRAMRTGQAKFDAVLELVTGEKTAEEICLERGLPRRSLYRWRQQLLEEGPAIFEREEGGAKAAEARVAELEQMVGRLTMEMEVLKKASGLLNARSKQDAR
jgi:transposase